ncbi:MAG: HD domain-containing protein [bacterium]|nr:HD domain-containing protein [bacterium]
MDASLSVAFVVTQFKTHLQHAHAKKLTDRVLLAAVATYGDKEMSVRAHLTLVARGSLFLNEKKGNPVQSSSLCLAALMHDIGKAAVMDNVFGLPRTLSPEEDIIKRKHTVLGGQICQKLGEPFISVAPWVRGHHESWNGSGYPDGLKGETIPHALRFLRLADVIGALRISRRYRAAFSLEESFEILQTMQRNGPVFDPSLMPFVDDLLALTK